MNSIDLDKPELKSAVEPVLLELATKDPDRTVQGTAIGILGTYKKDEYKASVREKDHRLFLYCSRKCALRPECTG